PLPLLIKENGAVGEGEEGIVAAAADVAAGEELGSPLPDDDAAGADGLPAVDLHAQVLWIGIAAIAAGALALLVCHDYLSLNEAARGTWPADLFFLSQWEPLPSRMEHQSIRPRWTECVLMSDHPFSTLSSFFSSFLSGSFFGSPRMSRRGPGR